MLYLSSGKTQVICVSGIHIPPTGAAPPKHERLETIREPAPEDDPATCLSRNLAGDFNITSCEAKYTEWLHDEGITGMTNPETRTFATGSALGKFPLKPGIHVPASLVPVQPQSLQEEIEIAEHALFPCRVVNCSHTSDHFPIIIPVTYQPIPSPAPERKLRIQHLSQEDWGQKNQQLQEILRGKLPSRTPQGVRNCPGTVFRSMRS